MKSFQNLARFAAFLLNAQIFFQYFCRDRLFEWKYMWCTQKQGYPRQDGRVVDANFTLFISDNKHAMDEKQNQDYYKVV